VGKNFEYLKISLVLEKGQEKNYVSFTFLGGWRLYTVKKVSGLPVPSRDVTYQTLPDQE
jgi:hypothetical protein